VSIACLSHATGGWSRSPCLLDHHVFVCKDAKQGCEEPSHDIRLSMSDFKSDVLFWETIDTKSTIKYILITTSATVGIKNVV